MESRNHRAYRKAKPYPFRLRQNSIILLEDELYPHALSFLSNILHSSASGPLQEPPPAFTPFPQQLALFATLAVHPSFTTHAALPDKEAVAISALSLLRDVNALVGPVNAEFGAAFTFPGHKGGANRWRDNKDEHADKAVPGLEIAMANSRGLWARADDFWAVVGWAFNCSVKHKKRWEWWKVWMAFMVEVLEDDWSERRRICQETVQGDVIEASLLAKYLEPVDGRHGRRRVMRAVLADGSGSASNEFPEVFKDELKEKEVKKEIVKPKKLDLQNADFGDYDLDEDETMEDVEHARPRRRTKTETIVELESDSDESDDEDTGDTSKKLGGMDSIKLRCRLLTLLSKAATHLPRQFTNLEDVLDTYTEFLRPLPLHSFSSLLLNLNLDPNTKIALLGNLLLLLLNTINVYNNIFHISQSVAEKYYLPYAANGHSRADHAKVSLILESMLLELLEMGQLKHSHDLRKIVETGIAARRRGAIGDARKKGKGMKGDEAHAVEMLKSSGERLLDIVGMVEAEAGVERPKMNDAVEISSEMSELSELDSDEVDSDEEEMSGQLDGAGDARMTDYVGLCTPSP
ncbi:hypothetical protein K402DRAFT_390796 [Aulographum hederae CBS 113979]|uniref:Uncharacterized protein n=1 Tax=Aulographum hederae CBS 113979 TaxID=1176131 RepID=A0A6G1H9U2_9PEZI|nr:hypothetical protein K402DRAFT_390796 [Aulographum hederae CBS 113979]